MVSNQAWNMLIETIKSKGTTKQQIFKLEIKEINWLHILLFNTKIQKHFNLRSKERDLKEWRLRIKKEKFRDWILNQNNHILLFEGASKNNTRLTDVCWGVLFNSKGNPVKRFAWGWE